MFTKRLKKKILCTRRLDKIYFFDNMTEDFDMLFDILTNHQGDYH